MDNDRQKRTGKTKSGVPYEIIEQIALLNNWNGLSLELNRISYDGKKPVLDIRRWAYDKDGNREARAGISLNEYEEEGLKKILWG